MTSEPHRGGVPARGVGIEGRMTVDLYSGDALGHNESYLQDKAMQVTLAFNHFGEGLIQSMPRDAKTTVVCMGETGAQLMQNIKW